MIPPLFKTIFFSLFVFTIGYKSGPEFFASLSLRTLTQVGLAVLVAITGLSIVLAFAFIFHLDPGTASGLASGALTQSSMIGTSSGALAQLSLPDDVLRQQQANIAAGYAVTYILGYILTFLFVPFVAPWLMGIDLKEEAAKLEAELSGGRPAEDRQFRVSEIQGPRLSGRYGRRPDGWRSRIASASASSSSELSGATMTSSRHMDKFSKPAMTSSLRDRRQPSSAPEPASATRSKALNPARMPAMSSECWSTIGSFMAAACRMSSIGSAKPPAAYSCGI